MDIPNKIGWKRLFLTGSQKFMLDLQRLGSKQKPDKVEQVIIFLEGLAPGVLKRKAKRHLTRVVINIYWHVMPKRLKVTKSTNPIVHEYLPWFSGKNKRVEQHLYQFGEGGKILTASSGRGYNKEDYCYSWKKAYKLMRKFKKEAEQREIQCKLDYELNKMRGDR